jgi:hypothetical protein
MPYSKEFRIRAVEVNKIPRIVSDPYQLNPDPGILMDPDPALLLTE